MCAEVNAIIRLDHSKLGLSFTVGRQEFQEHPTRLDNDCEAVVGVKLVQCFAADLLVDPQDGYTTWVPMQGRYLADFVSVVAGLHALHSTTRQRPAEDHEAQFGRNSEEVAGA